MSLTDLAAVSKEITTVWSPLFTKELREGQLLASLVNKDYQGEIRKKNDTVKVSEIQAIEGSLRTVGVDADTFESEQLTTIQIDIKADKRATAAFEFEDLVEIQSLINKDLPDVREALRFSVDRQINDHLYSLVAPSTATPDHVITGVTDMNATQLGANRILAAKAHWMKNKAWWALLDPQYYGDILQAITMTSSDHVPDQPVVGGNIATPRFGFNILEDDSRGLLKVGAGGADTQDVGLFFHPDFLHLVMQTEVRFQISNLHAQKKFGFLMSVDVVFGAKLSNAGDVKHITTEN